MKTAKLTLKLVRSFSIGISIYSPRLNGLYAELHAGCFTLSVWSRGQELSQFRNYWRNQG